MMLIALLLALSSPAVGSVSATTRPLSVVCFSPGTIQRALDNPLLDESRKGGDSILPVYFRGLSATDMFTQDCEESEEAGLQSLADKLGGHIAVIEKSSSSAVFGALLRSAREGGFDSMHVFYVNTSVVASPPLESSLMTAIRECGLSRVDTVAIRDDLFITGGCGTYASTEPLDINDLRFDRYKGSRYSGLEKRVRVPAIADRPMTGLTNILAGVLSERARKIDGLTVLDGISSPTLLTGEDLAIKVVTDYINSDDMAFSFQYRHRYVDEFSTSAEHRRSLARLADASGTYTHFFQGEVIASFVSRFLAQGTLSPRVLVHARSLLARSLAKRFESPLVCRLRNEVVRKDWHAFIARSSLRVYDAGSSGAEHVWSYSYSRFKGHLMREASMGTPHASQGQPWIVFVHGFGGSLEQCTQLARAILRRNPRIRISALDLMGFGHSEKVPLSINQYFWRDQVVRYLETSATNSPPSDGQQSSVILMGNSIGGFIAAAAASHLSETENGRVRCDGLVLFNSAGQINSGGLADADIDALFPAYRGPPGELLRLFGRGVFSLLQPRIQQTCEWLYPTNPLPVREGTAANILRDSCDIGAEDIIAAGGKLPKPEPFNSLLRKFRGRVLVAQGIMDPLNDARARAAEFGGIRDGITVDLLKAGHCPMEELPEEVAESIVGWLGN